MITAIVLAGGLGTRLRATVPDLPKPMAPVNGRPFLEHLLGYWIGQGVARFVLSVGYRHEAIRAHFGAAFRRVPLAYAVEARPIGTGGGLLLAAAQLPGEDELLVLNGDTFFAVDLGALRGFHRRTRASWSLALFRTGETGRYMGIELAPDGRIRSLTSGGGQPGRLANGGVYLVRAAALRAGGAQPGDKLSLEDDLLTAALRSEGGLYGLECGGTFIDIGVPADYARAGALLGAGPQSNLANQEPH